MGWITDSFKEGMTWVWEQFEGFGAAVVDEVIALIPDSIALNFAWLSPYWAHVRWWLPVDALVSMTISFYGFLFVVIVIRLILRAIPTIF